MGKKIFPGNYVAHLSSYQSQGVAAVPGRVYYSKVGYATITATGATSWDVVIGSPDLRADDKPRADIESMKIPAGAYVYSVALRVPDMRRELGKGDAKSGLSGTNTNRLKAADALANDDTITTSAIASKSADVVVASGTIAPVGTVTSVVTAAKLAAEETIKVYSTTTAGTAAGSNITSSETGGTPIIVEVCYFLEDEAPGLDDIHRPYQVEAGAGS